MNKSGEGRIVGIPIRINPYLHKEVFVLLSPEAAADYERLARASYERATADLVHKMLTGQVKRLTL